MSELSRYHPSGDWQEAQPEVPTSELKASSSGLLLLYQKQTLVDIWNRHFSELEGMLQNRKRPMNYHRICAAQPHLLGSQNSNEVF